MHLVNKSKLSYSIFAFQLVLIYIVNQSCHRTAEHSIDNGTETIADTEKLIKENAPLFIDTVQLKKFITEHSIGKNQGENIQAFYGKRNDEFIWINKGGVNEYARNYMNLLNQENIYLKDSTYYFTHFYSLFKSVANGDYKINEKDTTIIQLELFLTASFFEYAKRNWGGAGNEFENKVSWYIHRNKLNYENLLDSILKADPKFINTYEPVYRQYGLLKKYLKKYYAIENAGGWKAWTSEVKNLNKGDTSIAIISLKKQLYMLADLGLNDSTNLFDEKVEIAVKKFQKRNGLKENGIVSGKTLIAMSKPVHEQIIQILINMERCKWVPIEQKGDYLIVNIPEFKLHVYNSDSLEWSCNVIVGKNKIANNTVIFNDYLETIVFSPYWNIPRQIIMEEILPEMKNNVSYLGNHNMEILDMNGRIIDASAIEWKKNITSFPYQIRQKPGKNNALGLIKFLFPNSYDIYMHDTPEKSLFRETVRSFSHGCIRLQEPVKLAEFLLRDNKNFSVETINKLRNGEKQTFVKPSNKVPVFIAYFTAWVDREGKLNFRDDIYGHDKKMKLLVFETSP